jgi:hypothetical protein
MYGLMLETLAHAPATPCVTLLLLLLSALQRIQLDVLIINFSRETLAQSSSK